MNILLTAVDPVTLASTRIEKDAGEWQYAASSLTWSEFFRNYD